MTKDTRDTASDIADLQSRVAALEAQVASLVPAVLSHSALTHGLHSPEHDDLQQDLAGGQAAEAVSGT